MKLRKGRYAKWQGNVYELASYQRIYYLSTDDSSLAVQGFRPQNGRPGRYIREVSVKDLEDAYEVIPYTIYKSHRFLVEGETEDGNLVLITSDPYVRNDVNVKPYGRHEFIIEVSPNEVDLAEERRGILGFSSKASNYQKYLK